jgi:hypothetical protein
MISARSRVWLVPILASRSESTYSSSELLIEKPHKTMHEIQCIRSEDTMQCGK